MISIVRLLSTTSGWQMTASDGRLLDLYRLFMCFGKQAGHGVKHYHIAKSYIVYSVFA